MMSPALTSAGAMLRDSRKRPGSLSCRTDDMPETIHHALVEQDVVRGDQVGDQRRGRRRGRLRRPRGPDGEGGKSADAATQTTSPGQAGRIAQPRGAARRTVKPRHQVAGVHITGTRS